MSRTHEAPAMTTGATPLLVRPDEAARQLGLSERKLWSLRACNAIPSRQVGRSVRYAPDELRAWVDAGCPTEPGSADAVRSAMGGRR